MQCGILNDAYVLYASEKVNGRLILMELGARREGEIYANFLRVETSYQI